MELATRILGSAIGVEVSGARLDSSMDAATVDALRTLVSRHKVVFLRAQDHLDDDGLVALASLFGPPLPGHPLLPCDPPEVLRYSVDATAPIGQWRQDMSFLPEPPVLSFRRAVQAPAYGGNCLWANTAAAFATLPAPLQNLSRSLWAIHHIEPDTFDIEQAGTPAVSFDTQHPVVRVHPDTGEECLVLGGFVRALVGLQPEESAIVLSLLHARVTQPANTVRWAWQPGDLVISDNRATLNCTAPDFGDGTLELSRVSVASRPASSAPSPDTPGAPAPGPPTPDTGGPNGMAPVIHLGAHRG